MYKGLNRRMRFRMCSDCQSVIYDCDCRRPIDKEHDELIVREMCQCCDRFPYCERVEYLRTTRPGDWMFADLDTPTRKAGIPVDDDIVRRADSV